MPEIVNVDVEALSGPAPRDDRQEENRVGNATVSVGRVLWPTLLSLLVVSVIAIRTFNVEDFANALRQLNPWYLGIAVLSVAGRILLGGWRLSYVSRGRLSLTGGIRGQLAWEFFSTITPSAIGGGPVAALFIAKDRKIPVGEATALMLFTMLLDQLVFALLIPVLLFSMPFMPVLPVSLGSVGRGAFMLLFVAVMTWVLVFGYAVLLRPELMQKAAIAIVRLKWLRRYRERVLSETNQLRDRTKILRTQPPSFFIYGFLITLGTWVARFTLPMLIVMSVFPEVDKALIFMRTMAMTVSSIILPTPGGSGGLEGLYALLIGPMIPAAVMAPTLLTWRLLSYYVFLFFGAFLSMHHVHKSVRSKRRRFSRPAL